MKKRVDEWYFLLYALPVPFLAIGIIGGVYGSYFDWLRFLVSFISLLCLYLERLSRAWLTIFITVLIIYNPIIKFTATRGIWVLINIMTIITLVVFIWRGRADK